MIMKFVFLSVVVLMVFIDSVYSFGCGCKPVTKRSLGNVLFGEGLKAALDNSPKLVDGDQMFIKKDKLKFMGFRASIEDNYRWPNNELIFSFEEQDENFQNTVRQALSDLSSATNNCVKFREVRSSSDPHVKVFQGGGCYSYIGRIGIPAQDLSLGYGCTGTETIQHEFMHALGFYHEQSRPDRDQFVTINWASIDSQTCSNFQTCRGCKIHTPYDIKSIMQYQGNAFSCDGQDTMLDAKEGSPIPRNMQLTEGDITKIKKYYGC